MPLSSTAVIAAYGFVLVATLLLGFAVYQNNRWSATNQIFAFLSGITVVWLTLTYISTHPAFVEDYLPLARLTIVFAPLQALSFFFLAHTIPSAKFLLSRRRIRLLVVAAVAVMGLCVSPFVFSDVTFAGGKATLIPGPGMPVFVLFVSALSLGAIVVLIRHLRKKADVEKKQLMFVLAGICLMLGLIITTIMVPVIFFQNDFFITFAPLYVFIFLAMTAVAILRYRLFNLRIIATEFAVTLLVMVLIFGKSALRFGCEDYLKTIAAIIVGVLGASVVRSVYREIKQREGDKLAASLEKSERAPQTTARKRNFCPSRRTSSDAALIIRDTSN